MDETYMRIRGEWFYYYRAINKFWDIIDYYLNFKRDEKASKVFPHKDIAQNSLLYNMVIDGSSANHAAISAINI